MSPTSHRHELDLLRRQVADLARELAERDRVLREQTRHFEVAQALAHLGSWNWDIASGEVEWSDELYRIFGYEPRARAITFDSFVSAVLPDDHDRVLASIDDALAGAAAYDMECRIVRPDGEVRTIHCCGEVVRDSGGQPLRMSGTALDITDGKRTEAMLRTSRERLRQALRASGTGLWEWNTETNDVVFSEEWKCQLGYGSAEIRDSFEAWMTLLHPEDRDAAMAYVRDYVSRREGDYRQEFRLKHKDGEYRWIEARASFVTEADGRQIRLLGSHTDITDRKWMEESVRESEEWYRTLVELSPSGVFVFSEGRTAYINHTGTVLLGANAAQEILDRPTFQFIHPDYHQEVRENVKRLLSGGMSVHSAERIYLKMDGTPIPVQVEAARITWNGKPAIIGLFSDITERKQAEQALWKSRQAIRALHDISSAQGHSFKERVEALLQLGCRFFDLPIGMETFVRGDELEVGQVHALGMAFHPGMRVALSKTYCSEALRQNGTLSFEHAGASPEWQQHPAYAALKLESYIGTAMNGQERTYGTLCFASVEPRQKPFTYSERDFIQLMARWLGGEMDRRSALDALSQSEERYRTLYDETPSMYFTVDGKGIIRSVNEYGARYLGYRVEDLVGKSVEAIIFEADRECICAKMEAFFRHPEGVAQWEFRKVRGDGTVLWVHEFVRVLQREVGESLALIVCDDITERRHAGGALRESEERFSKAFRTSPHPIGITEAATGRCIEVNDACLELFGFRREEVIGNTTLMLGIWPNLEDRAQVIERLKAGQPVRNMEFVLKMKSGASRYLLASADLAELNGTLCIVTVANDITDRKQAEEALRRSEERFAKAFQASPHPVVISELDSGLVVDANDAACQLLGYRKEDGLGHTTLEIGLWPLAEERARFVEQLKSVGSVRNMEVTMRRGDGEIRQILLSSELIELNGKQCSVTVGDDITESKRLEKALRLTQFSVDQAVEAILWLDPNARIFSVNDTACRMLEYSREQLLGMTVHDIDPDFPVERWVTHWKNLKQQGALTFDAKFWSRSGLVLQTDVTVNYLQHEGKEYACMILRDIGERKRAEAELRRSHTFLRQVIDTDPDLIFAKDRDGRFTVANKAVADWYGTTVEELIGKADSDFNANAEEVEFFRRNDLEVIYSGRDRFIPEERLTDAEGKTRWLQTVKRPIYDDQGQVHMVLGAATDITECKRMEEILVQRERDLSAALQERERISQDLHDGILQSLYAVGLGLEACKPLIRKRRDPVAKKFMATLDHAIGQLNQVMTEVRNFIAGLESQVLQGGDFSTALRTMVETMSISSSTRCRVRIDDEAARRLSTEQALHIINIVREGVSNALRHSRAKQITVSLRDLIRSDRLAVTDDGIGFSTRSVQGVGHGLVNMAARAQKVRGLFAIQSKPDKGTRISLDLPKDTHYAHN
ncbi:MAG: PAS domain S-box protein [Nitrospira sp.]|nr:MAG: PAS domain S-box protein [Nitrospira sp.]